jgi:hypothetical protein
VDWTQDDAPCREVEDETEPVDIRNQLIELLNEYWWEQWISCKEESGGDPCDYEGIVADRIIGLVSGDING